MSLEGIACAKILGQDSARHSGGTVRRPVWLQQSERGGEREGVRAGSAGLCCREDLREMGAPSGLGEAVCF